MACELTNRRQYVMINDQIPSNAKALYVEFPRARCSVLSFSPFYINDLFLSSKCISFILSAYDTNISFRHQDLPTPINIINQELLLVSSWFRANKLTVHPDKSNLILFHPQRND